METDKYLTLISETHNSSNFTVTFVDYLTLGDEWEVALVQAYVPHRDSHFADSFKAYFPTSKVVGGLSVHYNASPTATLSASKQSRVRVDDIIDGISKGATKFDVVVLFAIPERCDRSYIQSEDDVRPSTSERGWGVSPL